MRTNDRQKQGTGPRHMRGALLSAALLSLAAGCGVSSDVQDDATAQEVMDNLGGFLGADGRTGCTIDLDGGAGVCRSEAEWQKVAEAACPAHGLSLVAYKTFTDCGPGRHRRVAYACCPDVAPPPPPPPPGPMCTTTKLGDGRTCVDISDWKTKATATCDALKMSLTDFKTAGDCGMNKYTAVSVTCCPSPPPPPPPMCTTTKIGDGRTCLDLPAWKTQAAATCDALKQSLSKYTPTLACGMTGLYSIVEVTCCGAVTTPMCFSGLVGTAGTCQSQSDLKAQADAICSMKMYHLQDISYGASCGMGGSVEAKYACCM